MNLKRILSLSLVFLVQWLDIFPLPSLDSRIPERSAITSPAVLIFVSECSGHFASGSADFVSQKIIRFRSCGTP